MLTKSCPKVARKFSCDKCDYDTSKKSSYTKHLMTRKHLQLTPVNNELTNVNLVLIENEPLHTCSICTKSYKSRVGLWKHNKVCLCDETIIHNIICDDDISSGNAPSENMIISTNPSAILSKYEQHEKDITQLTHLVIEVVRNNSELQKQMLDMCKNMQNTMTNCNNTNSHNTTNNSFNLQVFLNEHCKDAMNISEFIDSFDLQISDLENVGRQGYIEGMSTIIINKIKDMDVNKRPLHCSDLKREVIYIKDDDVWEREDANNTKFRKVIGKVMRKNIGMLTGWRDKYPDCMDIESEYNDIYIRLTKEAMGPDDTIDSENKIIKRVLKHIVIDKKAICPLPTTAC